MKMVRLIKRALKRMVGIKRLQTIQPLNNEELPGGCQKYVTYFASVIFYIGEYNGKSGIEHDKT